MRAIQAFCILAMLLLAVTVSAKASSGEAREHYRRANTLYDLRRFAEAAEEYARAFEIVDDPALLFNIAQAQRMAGEYDAAILSYRAFLRRERDPKLRDEAMARMRSIQENQERQRAQQPRTAPPAPTAPEPRVTPSPAPDVGRPIVPNLPKVETATAQPLSEPSPADRRRVRLQRMSGVVAGVVGGLALGGAIATAVVARQASDSITHPGMHAVYDPSLASRGEAAQWASVALFTLSGVALAICAGLEVAAHRGAHPGRGRLRARSAPGGAMVEF